MCWLLEEAHADPTIPVPKTMIGEVEEENDGHKSDASNGPITLPTGYRRSKDPIGTNRLYRI
ncbi:hypothetical protein L208DRAFT_1402233 [Tricholoma matsutake]|nr:hypothetical protein L208DRAFT_1402233 [Tricholoma matsutake 945]